MLVDEKISVLEAVLFASGDPVSKQTLCNIIDVDEQAWTSLLCYSGIDT